MPSVSLVLNNRCARSGVAGVSGPWTRTLGKRPCRGPFANEEGARGVLWGLRCRPRTVSGMKLAGGSGITGSWAGTAGKGLHTDFGVGVHIFQRAALASDPGPSADCDALLAPGVCASLCSPGLSSVTCSGFSFTALPRCPQLSVFKTELARS